MLFWGQTLKSDPKKLWETLKKFDYPLKVNIYFVSHLELLKLAPEKDNLNNFV